MNRYNKSKNLSVYQTTQYQNIPRDPPMPFGYAHLSGNIPQTHYPYDSVYDTEYQSVIMHPKYRWYGNMEYPYHVRRQRVPKVFTRPKPNYYKYNNYYYQIPNYPPYVHWYPNPMLCRDTCGDAICNEYFRRINDYRNCLRCQMNRGKPMCWSPEKQDCVDCPPEEALAKCNSRDRFGCANPNGFPHADVPPVNPIYTGCMMCN